MVIKRVRDLSPCHLQLIAVHDLMQSLIKERDSDWAHQHCAWLRQSGVDEGTVEQESLTLAWGLVHQAETYNPQQLMCCEFIGDHPLSEDLWQTADGLLHAALHLDTLEDF